MPDLREFTMVLMMAGSRKTSTDVATTRGGHSQSLRLIEGMFSEVLPLMNGNLIIYIKVEVSVSFSAFKITQSTVYQIIIILPSLVIANA
jgi:hypothetical protein